MKFYYNGKLIRTSKNHIYTHAVIDMGKGILKGCRSNEDAAKQIVSSKISDCEGALQNCDRAIKALKAGEPYFKHYDGRKWSRVTFKRGITVESHIEWWEEFAERMTQELAYVRNNWKVVELEAR